MSEIVWADVQKDQEENKMKNVISTDKAPAAIGPYSQAIEVPESSR